MVNPSTDRLTKAYLAKQTERTLATLDKIVGRNPVMAGRVVPDAESIAIHDGRRLDATVMFLDICKFSNRPAWTEQEQETLLRVLSLFFTEMIRVVEDYGGVVEKIQRDYQALAHVQGKPFALALADFHAPSSMVWSREALSSYLYGIHAQVIQSADGPQAIQSNVTTLRGPEQIPAGLFRDPDMAHLSAVISSNAATIAKFNRMGYLAGWRPHGLKMTRRGHLFDRTPGVLDSIPFCHDIISDDYAVLWPWGEAWCQELEVYHNPQAARPLNFDLLPGATHWFESDGEIVCSTMWKWSVLASVTLLTWDV